MKLVYYNTANGNAQNALQLLAKDILEFGVKINECHHVSQRFEPGRKTQVIETGSYCIETRNEITGYRYWVHFSGCKVTEIIEERGEEYESERD